MDERSFHGLSPVLGSHCILFQALAVVSKKIYIPLALVALFHDVNILVKALHLNLQSSLKNSPSVTVESAVMDIHASSWRKLFSSSSIYFSYSALRWFPRKFAATDFSDCQVDCSALLSASSNIGSFMRYLIWGPSNIPALSFSMLICGNFSWKKSNLLPSLSIAFTKFFITPNLICKGGSSILFCSLRGWDWTLYKPGFNSCLNVI